MFFDNFFILFNLCIKTLHNTRFEMKAEYHFNKFKCSIIGGRRQLLNNIYIFFQFVQKNIY